MVRSCGRFLADSVHLRLVYCNSLMEVCQEVSRINIWDAVVKEKGRGNHTKVCRYAITSVYKYFCGMPFRFTVKFAELYDAEQAKNNLDKPRFLLELFGNLWYNVKCIIINSKNEY